LLLKCITHLFTVSMSNLEAAYKKG
jgi:hypothetical protein